MYDYDGATDIAGKADYEIIPDSGSANPYDMVSDRNIENRSYTVWLIKAGIEMPSDIANAGNVMICPEKDDLGNAIEKFAFMIRVYRPDEGLDSLGGVSLPMVEAVKFGAGQTVTPPEIGMDLSDLQDKIDMLLLNEDIITTWEVQKQFSGDDIVFHRVDDAGLFPNAHTEYIMAPLAEN